MNEEKEEDDDNNDEGSSPSSFFYPLYLSCKCNRCIHMTVIPRRCNTSSNGSVQKDCTRNVTSFRRPCSCNTFIEDVESQDVEAQKCWTHPHDCCWTSLSALRVVENKCFCVGVAAYYLNNYLRESRRMLRNIIV